jgi:NifQ.
LRIAVIAAQDPFFPASDMKWKKFIYKQLCEAEGLYVCRAPSCEVCKDYDQCFGKEE